MQVAVFDWFCLEVDFAELGDTPDAHVCIDLSKEQDVIPLVNLLTLVGKHSSKKKVII